MNEEFKVGDLVTVRKDISDEEFRSYCITYSVNDEILIEKILSAPYVTVDHVDSCSLYIMNKQCTFSWAFLPEWFEHFDYLDII